MSLVIDVVVGGLPPAAVDATAAHVAGDEVQAPQVVLGRGLLLKFAVWALMCAVAVYVEFAAVYIAVSILFAIWRNLGSNNYDTLPPGAPRPKSAYSVFNPNVQRIDGDMDPSSIDRALRRQL